MSKILITGGAGFIGYHLADLLSANEIGKKNEVIIIDNLFRGRPDAALEKLLSNPNVSMIEADLTDASSLTKIGNGYDHVYHLAGINGTKQFNETPHEVLRVGASSTINILDWFSKQNNKKNAKILFVSSNETYMGSMDVYDTLRFPTPENVPLIIPDTYNPRWSYAGSKIIGELLFIHYAKAHGFRMVITRLHNVYGPRAGTQPMIPKMIGQIINKTDPFPVIGQDDRRSFCFVKDAVQALKKSMESSKTDGKTYHAGAPFETSIKEIVDMLFDISGWHPKKINISATVKGNVTRCLPDISNLYEDTGWKPLTSMKDGLTETWRWYNR